MNAILVAFMNCHLHILMPGVSLKTNFQKIKDYIV